MALSEDIVRARLAQVIDPNTGVDLVSGGALRGIGIDRDKLAVELVLGYPAASWSSNFAAEVEAALQAAPEVSGASVSISSRVVAHKVRENLSPLPRVKNIIAVASGKGGVGKSTTAVNLALALAAEGARAGVLDADIYGPSIPLMLGISGKPEAIENKHIVPMQAHGIQAMSIGFLIGEDTPMIWRGPMVTQAMQQLLNETAWQDLDYLIIDLPPGTGDIQLTLCQKVPVSGALIVTTPQDIALLDARKALKMFKKVEVPVLGIVENMAVHVCSNCGHAEHIFGSGGGERMASQYDVPLLGSLPLDIHIREQADGGKPSVVAQPDSAVAAAYRSIARAASGRLSLRAKNKSIGFPKIVVQNT